MDIGGDDLDIGKVVMNSPLVNDEVVPVKWNGPISYPGMLRIRTPMDGSCFFHALAKSYCKTYIKGSMDGVSIDRRQFVKALRRDLAYKLGEPVNPKDKSSVRYYDVLSRGNLGEFSKAVPKYRLENLQKELMSDEPVDHIYNEFISNQINKDIYLLDLLKQDVYVTGNDSDILYKDRDSIVIMTLPGHYELVGLRDGEEIKTLFKPSHPFIRLLKDRIQKIHGK